jgi:hypothetical protein
MGRKKYRPRTRVRPRTRRRPRFGSCCGEARGLIEMDRGSSFAVGRTPIEDEDDDEYEDDWDRGTVKELEKGAGYRYVEEQPIPPTPGNLIQSCMGEPYVLGDGSI